MTKIETKAKKDMKYDFSQCTNRELIDWCNCIDMVCRMYENEARSYDNTFSEENNDEVKKIIDYCSIKNSIIGIMENRIKELS